MNIKEVMPVKKFGGGMRQKGQLQVFPVHAPAIVGHRDLLDPRFHHFNLNGIRLGINRILD